MSVDFAHSGYRFFQALKRVMRSWDKHSRGLQRRFQVTTPQMLCLYRLHQGDGLTQRELCRELNFGGSTLNGVMDRLEEKGYIRRERSLLDRREVAVRITEVGRGLAEQAPLLLQEQLLRRLGDMPESAQRLMIESLEGVAELLESSSLPDVQG